MKSTFVLIVTLLMMPSKAYSAAAVEYSRVCVGTTTQKTKVCMAWATCRGCGLTSEGATGLVDGLAAAVALTKLDLRQC